MPISLNLPCHQRHETALEKLTLIKFFFLLHEKVKINLSKGQKRVAFSDHIVESVTENLTFLDDIIMTDEWGFNVHAYQ
jgi:hypothetical protein